MRALVITILLILSAVSYGQEKEDSLGIRIGGQVGMNASRVTTSGFFGLNKVGVNALLYARKPLNDNWDWEFNVAYSEKGNFKPPNPKSGDLSLYRMRLNYAEAIFWLQHQRRGIIYEMGIGAGYLLSLSEENEGGPILTGNTVRKVDAHLNAGILFPVSNKMAVGFRMQHSFVPLRQSTAASGTANIFKRSQLNQAITFSIRYDFLK